MSDEKSDDVQTIEPTRAPAVCPGCGVTYWRLPDGRPLCSNCLAKEDGAPAYVADNMRRLFEKQPEGAQTMNSDLLARELQKHLAQAQHSNVQLMEANGKLAEGSLPMVNSLIEAKTSLVHQEVITSILWEALTEIGAGKVLPDDVRDFARKALRIAEIKGDES